MKYYLEDLFAQADAEAGICTMRRNPVTGSKWVHRKDSRRAQMRKAEAALIARERFDHERPADARPLPLTYEDRENLKGTGRPIDYLTALYARSWTAVDFGRHPSFAEYLAGALASDMLPDWVAADQELVRRYPPTPLAGLGGGCHWNHLPKRRRGSRRPSKWPAQLFGGASKLAK